MKYRLFGVLCFFVVSVSAVQAATVAVFQESAPGAGDFSVLGNIQSFSTSETLSGFYDYAGAEFNNTAAVTLTPDRSHLFLVDASDGLGLFIVHDDGAAGNGGGRAEVQVDLSNDTAGILVQDDPSDLYTETGSQFTARNAWLDGFTDGVVIGSLEGNWIVDVQFADVAGGDPTIRGLNTWAAISSEGGQLMLALQEGRRVRLSVIPIPPAFLLFVSGIVGLIGLARRKKAA